MLNGQNVIVLDLETAQSAQDCTHCGEPSEAHARAGECHPFALKPSRELTYYQPIGWNNHAALGLSIGCYWTYTDQKITWFDRNTVAQTLQRCLDNNALLVTYNGQSFDGPLMVALVREQVDALRHGDPTCASAEAHDLTALCNAFTAHLQTSYDVLQELWVAWDATEPKAKFRKGLYALGDVAAANGLGRKLGHGAQAPIDWQAKRWAQVLNYCQDDVYKTKALFEKAVAGIPVCRGDGESRTLRPPFIT